MDWHNIKGKKPHFFALAGFASALVLGAFFYIAKPVFMEIKDSFVVREFREFGIAGTYRKHYHHFFETLKKIADAESSHESMIRGMAVLQKELEIERAKNIEAANRKETKKMAERLKVETGSPVALVPDEIRYTVPTELLPNQLFALGLEYFRKNEFEKSAAIFTELVNENGSDEVKTPEAYLVAAISWYRLKHFELSMDYLRKTQKHSKIDSDTYRQSLLWEAMVEKSAGNMKASQKTLSGLISMYPQSEEVTWINKKKTERAPSSNESSDE